MTLDPEETRRRYQATARDYDARYSEVQQVKYPTLIHELDSRPGERVLDWGCGTGLAFRPLSEIGVRYTGVDHSIEMLQISMPRTGPRLALADCARLPFKDRSFDAVLGATVIQNLKDTDEGLLEISRVLKPGGRATISHPARVAIDTSGTKRSGLNVVGRFTCGEDAGILVERSRR